MPPFFRKCNADAILEFKDFIWKVTVPPEPVRFQRRFVPQRDLERRLGVSEVNKILTHLCNDCRQHLEGNRLASTIDAKKICETATLRDLFALLTFIQCPRLIGCFLSQNDIEFRAPQSFSYRDLVERIFRHLGTSAQQVAEEFCLHMHQFGIPHFSDGGFTEYGEAVILPFLSEEKHAEGGHGTIYKVEIHPDYCSLMSSKRPPGQPINATPRPPNVVLARKTINNGDVAEFAMEKTNLEKISSLKHPNLISIMKTYKHGTTFNIFFSFVEINLYDYLRDANSGARRTTVVSRSPLWKQVLGLTEGLQQIIDFKDKDDPKKPHFGYHLDVKPQNVLVKRKEYGTPDVLLLTDFGQTQILPADLRGHSRIEVSGGTDAYVPPEYLSGEINRKYDVWSLGIILAEILTFAVRGADGVKTLDNTRHTRDDRGNANSRFFSLKAGKPEVKPEIVVWLDGLSDESPSISAESQQFVKNVRTLIAKMLDTNMDSRIGIDVVLAQMRNIFRIEEGSQSQRSGLVDFTRMDDEIELLDLRGEVQYYPSDSSVPRLAAFKTYEGKVGSLRTHLGFVETSHTRELTRFIPRFKFRGIVGQRKYDIGFSRSQGQEPGFLTGKDFFVLADQIEAKQMQERLTKQTIKKGFPISGVMVASQQSRGSSVMGLFSKSKPHVPHQVIHPQWIELWEEENPEVLGESRIARTVTGPQSPKEPRQPRKPGCEKKPNTRRVVIYCTDKIITIRFGAEFKLRPKPNEMKEKEARSLSFELTDPTNCNAFSIHYLRPVNGQPFSGIPMSRQTLFSVEDADTIKCSALTLTFSSWQVTYDFAEAYREMKLPWIKEENALKETPET